MVISTSKVLKYLKHETLGIVEVLEIDLLQVMPAHFKDILCCETLPSIWGVVECGSCEDGRVRSGWNLL